MCSAVTIVASVAFIECPECSEPKNNFLNDPRGGTFECDGCGHFFYVPEDTPVDLG